MVAKTAGSSNKTPTRTEFLASEVLLPGRPLLRARWDLFQARKRCSRPNLRSAEEGLGVVVVAAVTTGLLLVANEVEGGVRVGAPEVDAGVVTRRS